MRFLHSLFLYVTIVVSSFTTSVLSIIVGVFNPYSAATTWVLRTWGRIVVWATGSKLIVEGTENLDPKASYVFAANHLSALDICVALKAIPNTARFIAKKELFKIPVFSQGMKYSGMLPIDRGNSDEAKKTIEKAIKTIKDGCSVIIFPEGTRSEDGEVMPFKKGGFVLAINGQVPIVPTVISGTHYVIPNGTRMVYRGTVKIKFLPPVSTENVAITERGKLVRSIRDQIIEAHDNTFNKKEVSA